MIDTTSKTTDSPVLACHPEMLEMVEDSVRGLNDEQSAIARAILTAHLFELWAPGEMDRLLKLCTVREVAEEAGRRLAAR